MGKEQDFLRLIENYKRLILKVCRFYSSVESIMSAEDLFQDIVYNLWKSYPKYEKRPTCKVSTWIYRIALNVAISCNRKSQATFVPIDICDESMFFDLGMPTSTVGNAELYTLIEQLKNDEQAIMFLYIDDRTYQEIAEIMGITPSNVGTKIQRIKNKLKKLYHGQ